MHCLKHIKEKAHTEKITAHFGTVGLALGLNTATLQQPHRASRPHPQDCGLNTAASTLLPQHCSINNISSKTPKPHNRPRNFWHHKPHWKEDCRKKNFYFNIINKENIELRNLLQTDYFEGNIENSQIKEYFKPSIRILKSHWKFDNIGGERHIQNAAPWR